MEYVVEPINCKPTVNCKHIGTEQGDTLERRLIKFYSTVAVPQPGYVQRSLLLLSSTDNNRFEQL